MARRIVPRPMPENPLTIGTESLVAHGVGLMSIRARLEDADLLWRDGRLEGALLVVLVAVAATARKTLPDVRGDRNAFVAFLKSTHGWAVTVEFRGKQVDLDQLFYEWLRCELVHTGSLPVDVRVEDFAGDPAACSVRAAGAPSYTLLVTPGWYHYLRQIVVRDPVNKGEFEV